MEPIQRPPFDDMQECVRFSNGLDGIIWIIKDTTVLKTPIRYDIPSYQPADSSILEYLEESRESQESIEWEKVIFTFLNTKNSPYFIKSYLHANEGIFMEYVQGTNLAARIKTDTTMDYAQKFCFIYQLIIIIVELAQFGLAHGDVRPENFLLDSSDRMKCCDFASTVRLGEPYRRIPWPLYAKPTLSDTVIADESGQAFSIAHPIYFVITGHRPYHDKPLSEAVTLFREGKFPPTDHDNFKSLLPIGEIVRKCWHGEYAEVAALKDDIEMASRMLGIQPNVHSSSSLLCENDLRRRRDDCEAFLRRKRSSRSARVSKIVPVIISKQLH